MIEIESDAPTWRARMYAAATVAACLLAAAQGLGLGWVGRALPVALAAVLAGLAALACVRLERVAARREAEVEERRLRARLPEIDRDEVFSRPGSFADLIDRWNAEVMSGLVASVSLHDGALGARHQGLLSGLRDGSIPIYVEVWPEGEPDEALPIEHEVSCEVAGWRAREPFADLLDRWDAEAAELDRRWDEALATTVGSAR